MTETKSIYSKLLAVQKEIKPIVKDSTNPHFKNRYFDINTLLADIKPILNKHMLFIMQPLGHKDGKVSLITMLVDAEANEELTYEMPLPDSPDAQKYGSAITYFRRYALQSLLALEAEDDDGNTSPAPINNVAKPLKI